MSEIGTTPQPPSQAAPGPSQKRAIGMAIAYVLLALVAGTVIGGYLGRDKDADGTGLKRVNEQTAWGRYAYLGGAAALGVVGAVFGWVGKRGQPTDVQVKNALLWLAIGAVTGLVLGVLVVSVAELILGVMLVVNEGWTTGLGWLIGGGIVGLIAGAIGAYLNTQRQPSPTGP